MKQHGTHDIKSYRQHKGDTRSDGDELLIMFE